MKNILSITILSLALITCAHAANYDNPVEGKLKRVYSDFITLRVPATVSKSPDANINTYGDLAITLNSSKTVYDNFSQLSDLKEGDTLRVTYSEDRDGKKVAEHISRTELVAQDTTPPMTTTTQTTVTTTTVSNKEISVEGNP